MPNWKTPEAYQRLLAAMVAADGNPPNYRNVATYYGQGTTYDSIEGRFRIIRKEAAALKAEIESGERAPAPARGSTTSSFTSNASETTPKKPRGKKAANGTPTPKKEKVVAGRVGKNATPTKAGKRAVLGGMDGGDENGNVINGLKEEPLSSGSSHYGGEEDAIGDIIMKGNWDFAQMDGLHEYESEIVG